MTLQSDVSGNDKYIKVLDHGFVGLVDYMGSDSAVVQAARVSYGAGTKTVRQDRGLIRYLMRHKHTSPFEMNQIKLHIKLPIFVMRQLVRHRTSSLNEYSGRYSVMTDEFYVPDVDQIKPQSLINNQGRAGELDSELAEQLRDVIRSAGNNSYEIYQALLGPNKDKDGNIINDGEYDFFRAEYDLPEDFGGIAREIARTVLPVNNYTELYWTQNLHNMLHLLKLRMDSHAQWEIQEFANAIYDVVKPLYPLCCEAFEDYIWNAKTFSGPEMTLLNYMVTYSNERGLSVSDSFKAIKDSFTDEAEFIEHYRMSARELKEFRAQWQV